MPFVISNPHSGVSIAGGPVSGRIKKKDRRHRHATGHKKQRKRDRRQRHQGYRPSEGGRGSSIVFGQDLPRRESSLSDSNIIGSLIRYQYQSYLRRRSPGTRAQLSKASYGTPSASFSSTGHQHRPSSISASSSAGTAVIPSRISSFSEKEPDPISRSEFPPRGRGSSPIDQPIVAGPLPIPASGSASTRVAFGSLPSLTDGTWRPQYPNMGETTIPSVFLIGISSQCLHTLYAGSFVVYATNLAADWLHTYYACKGWSVTFALRPWLVILMVSCCALGGICNFLLLYLCIENALRKKWEGEAYEGGCKLIIQRFAHWIVDFDCFRISFLILCLQNAPMTVINYWFISSCSIPRPGKIGWTFVFACCATLLSVLWRILMTFFAYRNIRCVKRRFKGRRESKRARNAAAYFQLQQTPSITRTMTVGDMHSQRAEAKTSGSSPSTVEELRSLASGDLVNHYDECWPIHMSCWIMYNERDDSESESAGGGAGAGQGHEVSVRPPYWSSLRPPDNCMGYFCQASCCFCLCSLFYIAMFLSGCAPLAYHYTCRRNSRVHRHKFARTCTGAFSLLFTLSVVVVSVFLVISLLVVNLVWLSSVQLIGHNRLPPEISQICLFVHPELHFVHPTLMTSIIPYDKRRHFQVRIDCKPLFELNDQWGFWWQRRPPGPWLYQGMYTDEEGNTDELAVKTETVIGSSANETSIYVQFVHGLKDDCQYKVHYNWTIFYQQPMVPLPWPYWTACDRTYTVNERSADCAKKGRFS